MLKNKQSSEIRNIGIIAHIDAGKTTLSERFLYYSGKTHRLGDIDCGNTVLDYLDEERKRGITIVAAAASFDWTAENGSKGLVHLIDTPGHIDFTAEVERSLRVCDGAVVIFSAVEGVEAQSEKVWHQSSEYHVAKIAFINKLDRLGASFDRVMLQMHEKFGSRTKICAVQMPLGEESEFNALIDLVEMRMLSFSGEDGAQIEYGEIPEEYLSEARERREKMIAEIAELSEPVAEYYLDEKPIPADLLEEEIRKLVCSLKLCVVFAGSAKKNIGVQPVLDGILKYLPSPVDIPRYPALNPKTQERVFIDYEDQTFCGLIFKLIASGSADLLYLRSYSGTLKLNDQLINTRTKEKVKIKRLLRLYSKNIESIEQIEAGDIVGVIGASNTFTGDTLCSVNRPLVLERIHFPEPVISMALEPKSTKDRERLENCLQLLCREDPTLQLDHHENTGQTILSGMGELHLEINTKRIIEEFKVDLRCGKPRVAFRETLEKEIKVCGIFDKHLGDKQYYCETDIVFSPEKSEQGMIVQCELENRADIPGSLIEGARETLWNSLKTGGNYGYSLIYINADIRDIRAERDSLSEGAVAGAVMDAVNRAISQGTQLLEPLMRLEINSPEESVGEISSFLQPRRAVISGIEKLSGTMRRINCEVPLAEMFGFSSALPKLSGGRASFSMEPHGYQQISASALEKLNAG